MGDPDLIAVLRSELGGIDDALSGDLTDALSRDVNRPVSVALVGPSGVGKSTLTNALVGSTVADAGPLRPTTRVPHSYGPEPVAPTIPHSTTSGAVVIVDTPPSDHEPATFGRVLDFVDAAVVVTSPGRYADRVTRTAIEVADDRGVEMLLVVNRVEPGEDPAMLADIENKTTLSPISIAEGGVTADSVTTLHAAFGAIRDRIGELRLARRSKLALRLSEAVRLDATRVRQEDERRAAASAAADAAFAAVAADVMPHALRFDADLDASQAIEVVAVTLQWRLAEAAVTATAALTRASHDPPRLDENELARGDVAALTERSEGFSEAVVGTLRPRWMRWWGRRAAESSAWRLVLDPEHEPVRSVRMLLGDRRAELAAEGQTALLETIGNRIDERRRPFLEALQRPGPASERLEELAASIEVAYS